MKDSNEEYFEIVKAVGGGLIIIGLLFWFLLCSGCKVASRLKKSTNDSISVNKTNEGSVKTDSSGSKTENTKETVYYPQPIYIEGKNGGDPKIIFVPQSVKETGKTEQAQVVKDESWREAFDSLSSKILLLSQDKKTKVGPSFIEWILIAGLGLLLLKNFLPFKIIKT